MKYAVCCSVAFHHKTLTNTDTDTVKWEPPSEYMVTISNKHQSTKFFYSDAYLVLSLKTQTQIETIPSNKSYATAQVNRQISQQQGKWRFILYVLWIIQYMRTQASRLIGVIMRCGKYVYNGIVYLIEICVYKIEYICMRVLHNKRQTSSAQWWSHNLFDEILVELYKKSTFVM